MQMQYNSNNANNIPLKNAFSTCFMLGLLSFGDIKFQSTLIREKIVEEQHWVSHRVFSQLFSLGQFLPCSTTGNLITLLGVVRTQSLLGGILSFLVFSLPGAVLMTCLGVFYGVIKDSSDTFPIWLLGIETSVSASILAIFFVDAASFIWQPDSIQNRVAFWIALLVGVVLHGNGLLVLLFAVLFLGTVFLLTRSRWKVSNFESEESIEEQTRDKRDEVVDVGLDLTKGMIILSVFLLILITVITTSGYSGISFRSPTWFWLSTCFHTSSLSFGTDSFIFPVMIEKFSHEIGLDELTLAFAFLHTLPGPSTNIYAFFGGLIGGFQGALIFWISGILPGLILCLGVLPFWIRCKGIDFNFQSAQSVCNGFVIASVFQVYRRLLGWSLPLGSIFSLVSIILWFFPVYFKPPLAILFAGSLGFVLQMFVMQSKIT
eukprot:TRINITY_DN3933_c0_g2_i1.p1 TRINITY_DN3933_c0_g2~~TRINITY_DN3933_c0_g2_i1.p1  ORF type:complete len:432 (-),score=38.96 TRINITY_DN3933_c0_g2_i1:28-1323(-)